MQLRFQSCRRCTLRQQNVSQPRGLVVTTAVSWNGAPEEYSLNDRCKPRTQNFIASKYPELEEISSSGDLVVYLRPAEYKERRVDGYREPEEIYIIGTSHVSQKSTEDVAMAIEAIKPDAVVVELCKGRSGKLYQDQLQGGQAEKAAGPLSLTGDSLLQTFTRAVQLGGVQSLVVQVLLASTLKSLLPKGQDVVPGAEMIAARKSAEKLEATIVLGDRPIEITLSRCWEALSGQRKWQLIVECLKIAMNPGSARMGEKDFTEAVEKMKRDEFVEQAMQQLLELCPELVRPLVHERDLYLSWSMKRSKAVSGTRRVVGVVGKAHLRGIMWAMENDPGGQIRFSDLVGGRNTKAYKEKQKQKALQDIVRDTVVFGVVAWAVHYVGWI